MIANILKLDSNYESSLHELEISSLENLKESLEKKFECTLEEKNTGEQDGSKVINFYDPTSKNIYTVNIKDE